jgi:hypothetical protein
MAGSGQSEIGSGRGVKASMGRSHLRAFASALRANRPSETSGCLIKCFPTCTGPVGMS